MNYGALIFLTAFFALSGSWYGFVLMPQIQLGRQPQAKIVGSSDAYPLQPPGPARRGVGGDRAKGCVYFPSQQVGQTATMGEVELLDAGTNRAATLAAIAKLSPDVAAAG